MKSSSTRTLCKLPGFGPWRNCKLAQHICCQLLQFLLQDEDEAEDEEHLLQDEDDAEEHLLQDEGEDEAEDDRR